MLKQLLKTITRPIALGAMGFTLLMGNSSNAQVATDYTFSATTGTYSRITGGTVLGTTTSDDEYFVNPSSPTGGTTNSGPGFSIGFDFIYNGVTYDRFGVQNNGYVTFGQSALTPAVNMGGADRTPLTKSMISPSQLNASISAFSGNAGDLQGQSGSSLRYDLVGTAPSRTLIVQYENYRSYGYTGDSFNFQYRIYEGSNVIEMVYGTMQTASATFSQVGLLGFSATDYTNRTTTTDWTTTTAGSANSSTCKIDATVYPPSGLIYTWTPPARVYTSSTVTTASTVGVLQGAINQEIVMLDVVVSGYSNSLNATVIDVSTNGSTLLSDIDSLKVYFTGSSAVFSTATQFGSTVLSPTTSNLVSGSASLNVGHNYFWVSYDVSSSATLGDYLDAQIASVKVGSTTYVPTVTAPSGNRQISTPMTYVSSTTNSVLTTAVSPGTSNNLVAGITVVTSSTGAPIDVTSFLVSTTGTTSLSDISGIKIWYTGNSNTFATGSLFGSTTSIAATQTLTGSMSLVNDTNYFWVTYDVASGATTGNFIDAGFDSVTVDGTPEVSTSNTATGNRKIRPPYCSPQYSQWSYSCSSGYYYIDGVTTSGGTSNITNTGTGCPNVTDNYSNFTSNTVSVAKNTSFTLNVTLPGYSAFLVYIDYNSDGDFTDAGEYVYDGNPFSATTSGLVTKSINIYVPCAAAIGSTRMRLRVNEFNSITPDPCADMYYGETEDYTINILDNPTVYSSSSAIQQTGYAAPGVTNSVILRVPVIATGCAVGTATSLSFSTGATSNVSDIAEARLYSTGNQNYFANAKLLGTISSPSGQMLFSLTDTLLGNPGDTNNYWLTYTLSSGATIGNFLDATFDSIEATGSYHVPSVTSPSGNVVVLSPMTYTSSTAASGSPDKVAMGSTNNHIIGVQVVTSSTGAPIKLTSMDVATTGTTNLADITSLKVWYTGSSKTFATNILYGSVNSPSASQTITADMPLTNDTNYFWITYNIATGATFGDTVGAECTSISIDGVSQTLTTTLPSQHTRLIRYEFCVPVNSQNSTCVNSFYLSSVSTAGGTTNISNASGCTPFPNNYAKYPNQRVTVAKNTTFTLSINSPSSYLSYGVWIDYNQDGQFGSSELVGNIVFNGSTTLRTVNITVPCSATTGNTTMRIRPDYYSSYGTTPSPCATYNYGETEDYTVTIVDNAPHYLSSNAIQQTGSVSIGKTNRPILRVPVRESGCGFPTATQFVFSTTGSTNTGDITAAKLYTTGTSAVFNTNKLLGTVSSPGGQFTFTVADTLTGGPTDTNNYWLTYDISSGATAGDVVDATFDSTEVIGAFHVPVTSNPAGTIDIQTPMTYSTSFAVAGPTDKVAMSSVDNVIIGVKVVGSSTGAAIPLTSLDIATTGSTSLSDIAAIKVYYTGNSNTFAPVNLFGTVTSPAATQTITGSQDLVNDTNYFWITYDISSGATFNDTVDAVCTGMVIDGSSQTPTTTAPSGYRLIKYSTCIGGFYSNSSTCSATYNQITNVTTSGGSTNISNATTCAGLTSSNNYASYPNQVVTVGRNQKFTISMTTPNGYMSNDVWIDYNQDGIYQHPGEFVAHTDWTSGVATRSMEITIPCTALPGRTGLRVRGDQFGNYTQNNNSSPCNTYGQGETEDYIIDIQDNATHYVSSTTIQQTGTVAPSATNRAVLRIPVVATGCGVGTITDFTFSTTGTTLDADIASAKLYATGNTNSFNVNKLLSTVTSPSGQFTFSVTDTLMSNIGDTNNYWLAYDMSSGATLANVVDATLDSLQSGSVYYVPTAPNPAGNITIDAPMTYTSSTTTAGPLSKVAMGSTNNHVIGLQVVTSSTGSPIDFTSLDISMTGTTTLSDVTNLKVWYTGTSSTFATSVLFASVTSPSSSQTVTGLQALANGTNYFWITYDIASSTTLNDTIGAEVTSITVGAVANVPTLTNPGSFRLIRHDYCTPTISNAATACSANYYITNVSTSGGTTNISNLGTGCSGSTGNYSFYPNQIVTVQQLGSFTLSLADAVGGYMTYAVWIDLDQDGVFSSTELVGFYQYMGTTYTNPAVLNISIPVSATPGKTVMRVRADFANYYFGFGTTTNPPCDAYPYGESEDYVVDITPLPAPTTYVWNQTSPASYTVAANWTPSRTTLLGNDILVFNGGGSVTVNNVHGELLSKMVIDNATDVTLNASSANTLQVTDTLALTSGNLIVGTNVSLTLGAAANYTGALTGTGGIDGAFTRWIGTTTGSYDFPILVGTDNRKATISYTTAPTIGGKLTSQFVSGNPGTNGLPLTSGVNTLSAIGQDGVWRLASSGVAGGSYTATINASGFVGVTSYADLVLVKRSGSTFPWSLNGTHVTTTGSNSAPVLSRTGMSGFGEFGVAADTTGGNNPLPVKIISFTGMADARNAYLNWTTTNELNNKGFDVERSVDGKNFVKVAFVKGAGNSSQVLKYAAIDADAFSNAKSNVLYYRLKQLDFNGNYIYTEVVTVKTNKMGADAITVSPNPFNTEFSLSVIASKEGVAEVTIMDVQGRTVATTSINCTLGVNKQSITELANAKGGVYFVRCTLNGETSVTRLVKMN